FTLDLRLPVDDLRGDADFAELAAPAATDLDAANLAFWQGKLDRSGLQADLPPVVSHLFDLYRSCRADLLILADDGAIPPGPTIYDSFWIRDSSVEGIACALAGGSGLPAVQFGQRYPSVFNAGTGGLGPVQRARLLRRRARAQRPGVGRERPGAVGVRPVRPDPVRTTTRTSTWRPACCPAGCAARAVTRCGWPTHRRSSACPSGTPCATTGRPAWSPSTSRRRSPECVTSTRAAWARSPPPSTTMSRCRPPPTFCCPQAPATPRSPTPDPEPVRPTGMRPVGAAANRNVAEKGAGSHPVQPVEPGDQHLAALPRGLRPEVVGETAAAEQTQDRPPPRLRRRRHCPPRGPLIPVNPIAASRSCTLSARTFPSERSTHSSTLSMNAS